MWELKRADLELARQKLAELRSITLRRHAEEMRQLDDDEAHIDTLVRLAMAFVEKHGTERPASPSADQSAKRITPDEPDLLIAQNISPDFPRYVGRTASD